MVSLNNVEMRRLIVVCEGQTEREFCSNLLGPYLFEKLQVVVNQPMIKQSNGGIIPWTQLKKQITQHLSEGGRPLVTTFIDYYGLKQHLEFPNWMETRDITDVYARIKQIESGMNVDIESKYRDCFIPHIQPHEYEALLFCQPSVFEELFCEQEHQDTELLVRTINEYKNPELINNSFETSPSHRLERIFRGYDKILHGILIAEAIGIETMRKTALSFDNWLNQIEEKLDK